MILIVVHLEIVKPILLKCLDLRHMYCLSTRLKLYRISSTFCVAFGIFNSCVIIWVKHYMSIPVSTRDLQ